MFTIDGTDPVSESESDCDIPKFELAAFKKYGPKSTTVSSTTISSGHRRKVTVNSALDAGDNYGKSFYIDPLFKKINLQDLQSKKIERMKQTLNLKLENSIACKSEFKKSGQVPPSQSRSQLRKAAAKEREKTTGGQWFDMPAPEMTEEKKNDLLVLQMRQSLDPKHFYKRSARPTNPKFFQIGTFVESPVDFYSSRVPRKKRKQTLVDELLADVEFQQYQKKKFREIQQAQPSKLYKRKKVPNRERNQKRHAEADKRKKKSKQKT